MDPWVQREQADVIAYERMKDHSVWQKCPKIRGKQMLLIIFKMAKKEHPGNHRLASLISVSRKVME